MNMWLQLISLKAVSSLVCMTALKCFYYWHQEYSQAEKSEVGHFEKNQHLFIILYTYVKYMLYCNFILV